MSFDAASRQILEEKLGYERFVLQRAVRIQEEFRGIVAPMKMIINDTPPHENIVGFMDFLGAGPQIEVVRTLAPLIFVSAFKVCDMILEWVLEENGKVPPRKFWSFRAKAEELHKGGLKYPDFLATDSRFEQILIALFVGFRLKRNALIHGKWGREREGDLVFDFEEEDDLSPGKPRVHDMDTLSFADLLIFADFATRLASFMVSPASQNVNAIETFKWLSDRLASWHKVAAFRVIQPRFFEIVRRTSLDTVDLNEIRAHVELQAASQPYAFALTIEDIRTQEKWELSDRDCAGKDNLRIDELRRAG